MKKRVLSPRAIVLVCSIVYFVSYFSRKDFAATMVAMIEAGVIDKAEGGYIGMAMFVCYGIGQLVSGFLGDKVRPSLLLTLGLFTTSLSNLLMPLVPSSFMVPLWALNGFAQAMLWPPIVRILADSLDNERFVRANLVVTSAAHLATVLLYLYVPLCLSVFSWRAVFFSSSIVALLSVVVTVLLTSLAVFGGKSKSDDDAAPVSNKQLGKDNNYLHIALGAGLPFILCAILSMGFLRDGIESWLPNLLNEAFGLPPSASILLSVALPIFAVLSITVITVLHKTRLFGNEAKGAIVLFSLAALLSFSLVFTVGVDSSVARVLTLLFACGVSGIMHAINFLYISCMPGRFAAYGRAATTSGISNAFTYVGAAVSMYLIPAASVAFDWRAVMLLWMLVSLLGLVFSLLSLRRYSKLMKH